MICLFTYRLQQAVIDVICLYSNATADKISTDKVRCVVPRRQLSSLLEMV